MVNNKYRFYACVKFGDNGSVICSGRATAEAATRDLQGLINSYLTNSVVFIGVIKCSDGKPMNRIKNLNEV